jgi:hypothetical protein
MHDEEKYLLDFLFSRYKKMELSKKETANILNISTVTLDRLRNKAMGPSYKKMNSGSYNGTIKYPLHEIAKYLANSNIKTF